MGLFKPTWKSKNASKAVKAVAKTGDQQMLLKISKEATLSIVSIAAVEKITDQSILVHIAENNGFPIYARQVAIRKLIDQHVLIGIVMSSTDESIRQVAIESINDQNLLADLAKKTNKHQFNAYQFGKIYPLVVGQITNEELLADVASNASELDIRIAAIRRMTHQSLLADITVKVNEYNITIEALKKISNESLLAVIAKDTDNCNIGIEALKKISDRNLLIDLVRNAKDAKIRAAVMEKLEDQSLLFDIVMCDNTDSWKAMSMISDKKLLTEIHNQTKRKDIKEQALQKLGVYICSSCNKENWPQGDVISCECIHCQHEHHEFKYREDIREYRDYEVGSRWEECVRCGKKKNYESVNTM